MHFAYQCAALPCIDIYLDASKLQMIGNTHTEKIKKRYNQALIVISKLGEKVTRTILLALGFHVVDVHEPKVRGILPHHVPLDHESGLLEQPVEERHHRLQSAHTHTHPHSVDNRVGIKWPRQRK